MTLDQKYLPQSFGCHEALHMTSFLCDTVGNELIDHPAIKLDAEWLLLATQAHDTLCELYQAIGRKHL